MRKKYYASRGACALFIINETLRAEKVAALKKQAVKTRASYKKKTAVQPLLLPETIRTYADWQYRFENEKQYDGFLKIRDFDSMGTASAIITIKGQHMCHLMSRGERDTLTLLENMPANVEIFTQVALDPRVTLDLAAKHNIRHPRGTKDGNAIIMTSDFLVKSVRNGKIKWTVYSFKPKNVFDEPYAPKQIRTSDILKLERLYWESKGFEWKLIDRSTVCEIEAYNLRAFRDHVELPWLTEPLAKSYVRAFARASALDEDLPLEDIIEITAIRLKLTTEKSHQIFEHLAWHRRIPLNLNEPIELHRPLPLRAVKNAA